MPNTWVVAHRGASGHAPENTMAAFRRAVELGARFIETDLHLSRDAQLVAIHDDRLERTTNGHGYVHDFSLAELRLLDAGSWYGPQFAGERIPTIDEIVRFAREADVVFYLEVKAGTVWGVEHALVTALRLAQEAKHATLLSFDLGVLGNVRRLDPFLMTGFLFDQPRADAVLQALRVGARQIAPHGKILTPELIQEAHAQSLQVVTWTLNEPGDMRAAIAAGVDGIMSDYPDRIVSVLRASAP